VLERLAFAVMASCFFVFGVSALGLFAGAAGCGGDGDEDGGVQFEKPQILPDNNPVCISDVDVEVGRSRNQPILLQNAGRQPLEIATATIAFDRRGHFTLNGPEPRSVLSTDFAAMQLRYAPRAPGWDAVIVQVTSNAENYPQLDVYVLARAVPAGLDGGVYDAGPRPADSTDQCPNAP
jgi:hypothetical protein